MRTIKAIHKAIYEPIADLVTYRVMPTDTIPMNSLDPFIFLNHHGRQEYLPHNNGLPFGPHPHRGFETVTFIIEGDLTHKDTSGAKSVIREGGVQWMTAGSGLIHAEVSSEEFKSQGGPLEILQLWVNLPAKNKMTAPKYIGLQKEEIPDLRLDNGRATAHIVSGTWDSVKPPVEPLTDIHLILIELKEGAEINFSVAADKNILLYVVRGSIVVNDMETRIHHLVEFNHDEGDIYIKASTNSIILFGYATPLQEPIVSYGPFVMNTKEEIMQAYDDYHKGKFGKEEALMG